MPLTSRTIAAEPPTAAPTAAPSPLLARARSLQQAQLSGAATPPLLRGRQLALMSVDPQRDAATLLRRAATELGAHVSLVRLELDARGGGAEIASTARLLDRLYDAVVCDGFDEVLARRLASAATIPVLIGLDDARHAALHVDALPGGGSDEDKRRWLLQAVLAQSLD